MRCSHEIWARAVWATVDTVEHAGLPTAPLFERVPFDSAGLRRLTRVRWDDYVEIVESITRLVGSTGALENLVEGSHHEVIPEIRALADAFVSPKLLIRYVFEVLDPILFPPVEFGYTDLDEHRVQLTACLRPGVRPCLPFFEWCAGALRGMPSHLGLPPAVVTHAKVGPDHGIYDVQLPPSRTLRARAHHASRTTFDRITAHLALGSRDGAPLYVTIGNPEQGSGIVHRLELARSDWGLTRRQLDVLRLVVEGKSNKEIANALDCADNTVEHHVTQMLRKIGAGSRGQLIALFWSRG